MDRYITYGLGNKFNISLLHTDLRNTYGMNKPKSAWWGSPIDAKFGWKEWCEGEEWIPDRIDNLEGKDPFKVYFSDANKIVWTLAEDSKIFRINSFEDVEDMVSRGLIVEESEVEDSPYKSASISQKFYKRYCIHFEKAFKAGYTAIEFRMSSLAILGTHEYSDMFYAWDCESIVVLDPSKIIQL